MGRVGERPTLALTREFEVTPRPTSIDHLTQRHGAYCGDATVRDYAWPFSRLPAVQPLPGGSLPFGSGRIAASRANITGVVAADWVSASYGISSSLRVDDSALGWQVRAELTQVASGGQPLRTVDVRTTSIGVLEDAQSTLVALATPSEVGIYRVDLTFADPSGAILGSYGEYLRVLPSRLQVRLGMRGGHVFHRGDKVVARLENPGTEEIAHGAGSWVERREGAQWRTLPAWEDIIVPAWLRYLRAGMAAPGCISFPIGREFSPGRYRIVKVVHRVETPANLGKRLVLTRPFTVLP